MKKKIDAYKVVDEVVLSVKRFICGNVAGGILKEAEEGS